MTAAIGIDLVEVSRIERLIQKWEVAFLNRVYTETEIAYCRQRGRPAVHFAARFAVKEAFLKALGMGLGMGIQLQDIETINAADGRPHIRPLGKAKILLEERDINNIQVSITHTRGYAAAVVIVERAQARFEESLSFNKEGHAAKI